MKKIFFISVFTFFIFTSLAINASMAKEDPEKFEKYRKAIKKEFNIDIAKFRERLKGGKADGQPITKYDLEQLIMGIKVELEHTKDKMTALEIATDHLEEIPDYYTRLLKMEEEAEEELKSKTKK